LRRGTDAHRFTDLGVPAQWGHLLFRNDAPPARKLATLQGIAIAFCVMVAAALGGRGEATAALFGGLAVFLPSRWFWRWAQRMSGNTDARKALGALYVAELGKLVLVGLMLWVGALLFGGHYLALMLTCMACLAMNWVLLAVARFD
jgi:F0F1-type ATP synthase assembly protein I